MKKILALAAKLPAGLNDAKAADKLVAERDELTAALRSGDFIGALTEGADAVYYAAKHLQWVSVQLGVSMEDLSRIALAKYALRARCGNPKDDAAERAACLEAVTGKYDVVIKGHGVANQLPLKEAIDLAAAKAADADASASANYDERGYEFAVVDGSGRVKMKF